MGTRKYMEVFSMYIIGVAFICIGLYMIMLLSAQNPIYAPMGFVLLVPGLFFSTIGGFYGKKKLLEDHRAHMEPRQMDMIKQNVVSQLKPPEAASQPEAKKEAQPATAEPKTEPKAQQAAPAEKPEVLKVMVCPQCNTENPPSNMFCFSCGKRLKAPAQKLKKPTRPGKAGRKKAAAKKA